MAITGEGARGDHAWFGYKATRRDWNLDAGRYEQDRYATGYALESQTGKRVKEHSLRLLADEQRRSPAWGRAETLVRLGDSLAASGRGEGAGQVYEMAVAAAPRHLGAWTARIGQMKRAAQPGAAWEKAFRDMRVAFRDYPDVLATVDALETERMLGKAAPADVGRTVGRQSRDIALHHEDRTDLVLETIVRQIALLEKAGEPEAVAAAYRKALRQYGDNAVVFRRLAGDYFDFGGRTNARGAALRDIDATFRRCYASAPAGDFFAMNAYAGMMDMMAGFYEQDGQADKAERLRRGAEKLLKTAQGGARYRK
jgi:tetratricopeptide (TPR) repeat protein